MVRLTFSRSRQARQKSSNDSATALPPHAQCNRQRDGPGTRLARRESREIGGPERLADPQGLRPRHATQLLPLPVVVSVPASHEPRIPEPDRASQAPPPGLPSDKDHTTPCGGCSLDRSAKQTRRGPHQSSNNLSSIEQDARIVRERIVGDVAEAVDVHERRLDGVGRIGEGVIVDVDRLHATTQLVDLFAR